MLHLSSQHRSKSSHCCCFPSGFLHQACSSSFARCTTFKLPNIRANHLLTLMHMFMRQMKRRKTCHFIKFSLKACHFSNFFRLGAPEEKHVNHSHNHIDNTHIYGYNSLLFIEVGLLLTSTLAALHRKTFILWGIFSPHNFLQFPSI